MKISSRFTWPLRMVLLFVPLLFCSWGFFAHTEINRLAVYTLPNGPLRFFKANIRYLSEHAVDPDKRRYADTAEAPRHYLDIERFHSDIDSIPRSWKTAVEKYGLPLLQENGILPWHIQKSYYQLVRAFSDRDSAEILRSAAFLGHYLADAHVPLHTTENHNGQLSHQIGIHAFWESRLPELYSRNYNYFVGPAVYLSNPLVEAWKIVGHTHGLVDSVLTCEAQLNSSFPSYRKYSFSKRKKQLVRQYSREYSSAYHDALNGMVEKQMRASIRAIGSFWYTAWVEAGQPTLDQMPRKKRRSKERIRIAKGINPAPL